MNLHLCDIHFQCKTTNNLPLGCYESTWLSERTSFYRYLQDVFAEDRRIITQISDEVLNQIAIILKFPVGTLLALC